jgi:hypothetical protein
MDRYTAETLLHWLPAKVSAVPTKVERHLTTPQELVDRLNACQTEVHQIDVLMAYLSEFGTWANGVAADCKPVTDHWARLKDARSEAA